MGIIFFNNIPSYSIPLVVEKEPSYVAASKDYEVVHVPGRNGDVLFNHNSYKNVVQPYEIAFGSLEKTHSEMAAAVSEWLHSASGYARLEDSYDPDHYRLAYYQEETQLENILNHLGRATINFNCMPQRFLKSGDKPIIFTKSGKINNPTRFDARPLLTVNGTGDLTVNGTKLKILSSSGNVITIDCYLGEAYTDTTPKNDKIQWEQDAFHPFPYLSSGLCDISFTSGITSVEVVPRWYII